MEQTDCTWAAESINFTLIDGRTPPAAGPSRRQCPVSTRTLIGNILALSRADPSSLPVGPWEATFRAAAEPERFPQAIAANEFSAGWGGF
jgi:hypothetical protein